MKGLEERNGTKRSVLGHLDRNQDHRARDGVMHPIEGIMRGKMSMKLTRSLLRRRLHHAQAHFAGRCGRYDL